MRNEIKVVCVVLVLSGCQSAPVQPPAAVMAAPVPAPEPSVARVPETVKTYLLGAYVDPDDPTLRHEAHWVQRIVTPAHWNLAPAENPASLPAEHVLPLPPMVRPAETPPPAPPAQPSESAMPEPPVDPEPAISPNAEGLVDLTAGAAKDSDVNPFAVRSGSAELSREVTLQVSGIVGGARPCAVINGRLLEVGASFAGFMVVRIESGTVVLTYGGQRLRLPLSDKPARVRLPS